MSFLILFGRCSANVGVAYPQILDMPVKLRLEFMSVISPNLTNAEGELLDNMVHEVYGVGLRVLLIDF